MDDSLFASVLVFLTSAGLIYYLYNTFKDRLNEIGGIGVIIIITGIFYTSWMIYLLAMGAHHKIMPHFEATEDVKNTRMQRVGKIAGFIVLVLGLVGTILSIVQFFSIGR